MKKENLDDLKSNLNNNHDSLSANENQGNHFVVSPPPIDNALITNAVHQSQHQGQNINLDIYNNQQTNQSINTGKKISIDKKTLIKIGSVTAAIGAIILVSWLGLRWYQRSSDERILATAAKNLLDTKDLHSKATIGVEGFSVNLDIYVDKDQDVKGTLKLNLLGEMEAEGLWFPSKDKAYIGSKGYAFEDSEGKMEYTELTNVKKTIEKYENEFALTDVLNPTKDFFSGENMKYVKREGTDSIDGKKLYKYTFKPTDEFIQEKLKKATKDKELPFVLTRSEVKIDFWITESDLKINKIDGEIKIKTESSEAEKKKLEKEKQKCIEEYRDNDYYSDFNKDYSPEKMCEYRDKDYYKQEFTLSWDQKFTYDFKDDIKEPDSKNITESIDIYKEMDQGYQNDKKKVEDLKDIQVALKKYYKDNGYYPKSLSQLKEENEKSDYDDYYSDYKNPYLYSIPESPDDNKYEYNPEGNNIQSYTLKVKLAAPEYYQESDYIKDGYLYLTEKSSSNFTLKENISNNNPEDTMRVNDEQRKNDLRTLRNALSQYSVDNDGEYPTDLSSLIPNYLVDIPTDPTTGNEYKYAVSSDKTEIELNATLENKDDESDKNDGGDDDDVYEVGDDSGLDLI